jgi:tetratricopeptide (TPR) repeat protein
MASRVNVKFVVILAAAMVVLFLGVAGLFVVVKMKSGERYLRMGDEAMARGDYTAADTHFGRAVGKDPANLEWLAKWRHAREHKVPENFSGYQQDYSMYVMGILRTQATLQRTNLEAHVEYLEALYQERASGASREWWETLINEVEFCLAFFDSDQPVPIRRYRGLAIAAQIGSDFQVSDERRRQAREDLEAALAADPRDALAARELASWHRAAAERARARDDLAGRQQHLQTSRRIIAQAAAAAPDHPLVLVDQLVMEGADVDLLEASGRSPADLLRMKTESLNALRPRLSEVHQRLMAMEPSRIDARVASRFMQVAPRLNIAEGFAMCRQLVDHALTHDPDSAELLALKANALLMAGDVEGALAQLGRIAELPNLPVSLRGIQLWEVRRRAHFLQAVVAGSMAVQATDAQARQQAMERAREFRRELLRHVPERSPEVLFVDGQQMFADGDFSGAQRALTEFVRSPGGAADQVPEAHLMLAECALRRDTPGLAREHLQHVQRMRPGALEVSMARGRIEMALQNYAEAERIYRDILERSPDHAAAREQLQLAQAMRGNERAVVSDPVVQVLVEADRLARGDESRLGDELAAIDLLRRSLAAHKYDPRLITALAQYQLMRDDSQGALQSLDEGLARHPGDAQLSAIRRRAAAVESLEMMIALIDESDAPELEKWLSKERLYKSRGQEAQAAAALEQAARLSPNDPRVVELQFVTAVLANDLARAEALAEQAARLDIDRADGDTFRARLQLAQGNPRQAVITLQRAAERGNATAALFRLLGMTQMQLGRSAEAISSLRRALELSPTDINSAKMLVATLAQANQGQEALQAARTAEFARRDPEFLNMWLSLEASTGNTTFARERREQIMARNPDDLDNTAALAELYITERRFERARQLIDRLAQGPLSTRTSALNARWHADQGNLERSRQVFISHIEALQERKQPTGGAYLAFGQFFLQRGQVEVGLEAMRQAASEQDPKVRSVDIAIGDVLFSLGRMKEAEQTYQAVLDAGIEDPQHALRKRLIETMVQQARWQDAERLIAALGAPADDDLELLALRSEAARGMGDDRRAREALDRAVARFPDEPLGYVRRARLLMGNPDDARDAMADLNTALRLRPGLWQALRMMAAIHFEAGRNDEGLRALVTAVQANPNLDDLRVHAVARLLRHGRESEALELATAGLGQRAGNLRLQIALGDAFTTAEAWDGASRLYRQVWESARDETAALRYVRALLGAVPAGRRSAPQLAEAEQVLATASLKTEQSLELLLARAALRRKQGRDDAARGDALQAFSLVGENPGLLMMWSERLRLAYPEAEGSLAIMNAARGPEGLQDAMTLVRAMTMVSTPAMRQEGISMLRALAVQGREADARTNALRILTIEMLKDENWSEALEVTQQALALEPEDGMLNNNAAYLLVDKFDRAAEALPFAEKAVAADPANWAILDTLAAVHWALGQRELAIQSLTRALGSARSEPDRFATALKLGRWKLEAGDRAGARQLAQLARETVSEMTDAAELRTRLNDFLAELGQSR